MITADFIIKLSCAIVFGVLAIFFLSGGVVSTEYNIIFCIGFLAFYTLSMFAFMAAHKEYQSAKPQEQVKILKQKINDAEREYQKYLIEHPEFKE